MNRDPDRKRSLRRRARSARPLGALACKGRPTGTFCRGLNNHQDDCPRFLLLIVVISYTSNIPQNDDCSLGRFDCFLSRDPKYGPLFWRWLSTGLLGI